MDAVRTGDMQAFGNGKWQDLAVWNLTGWGGVRQNGFSQEGYIRQEDAPRGTSSRLFSHVSAPCQKGFSSSSSKPQ